LIFADFRFISPIFRRFLPPLAFATPLPRRCRASADAFCSRAFEQAQR
jgi:hypothetical protein